MSVLGDIPELEEEERRDSMLEMQESLEVVAPPAPIPMQPTYAFQPPESSYEPKGRVLALSAATSTEEDAPPLKPADGEEWEYKMVEARMDAEYNSDNSNKSVICDIIAMYLKGQKILYTEAKTLCEQRMNYLMLPAIFITSACSILSLVLKDYSYGGTIVSSLNGFNAFLLALISYLKLDAKAEAHRTAAYKFDKLQSQLEFSSGKSMFMEMTYENMVKIINDAEADVREIKETNKFILPEAIRFQYPKLCNMNVFAEVKRIQNTEMQMTNRLMNVLNEQQWFRRTAKLRVLTPEEWERRRILKEHELHVIHDLIALKDDYLLIDEQFEKEMAVQRKKQHRQWQLCGWLKT